MSPNASTTASGTTKSTRTKKSSSSKRPSTRKSSSSGTSARTTSAKKQSRPRTATVTLPFVTAEFRAPDMHVPRPSLDSVPLVNRMSRPHLPEAAGRQIQDAGRAVGSLLPERKEAALFAGLAVATVAGALEWPVAVAVAVGTDIARRAGRPSREAPSKSQSESAAG